jgi:hypothetical protein
MNYKGLWKQAAKICVNVLSGHGTLAQEAGIPASQPRLKAAIIDRLQGNTAMLPYTWATFASVHLFSAL